MILIAKDKNGELMSYSRSLVFMRAELPELEFQLAQVLRECVTPGLAKSAENYWSVVDQLRSDINELLTEIFHWQFMCAGQHHADSLRQLRKRVMHAESDFVDLNFNCFEFLDRIHR